MRTRMLGLMAAATTMLTATPAMAYNWWLVALTGEKPARLFVAVDEDHLDSAFFPRNVYRLETFAILENEKSPDWVTSNVTVDCTTRALEESMVKISPRGGALIDGPGHGLRAPKDAIERQLVDFGCEIGPMTQAQRLAFRQQDNTARGLVFMGPLLFNAMLDLTWKILWKDGTRPPYNETRTPEELDRDFNNAVARAKQIVDMTRALAGTIIEDDEAWRNQQRARNAQQNQGAANDEKAKARRKREYKAVQRTLEPWIGQSETELVRVWGTPQGFEDKGDLRILFYRKGFAETTTTKNGVGQQLSASTADIACDIRFEFRGGRLDDYVTKGNNADWQPNACERAIGSSQ